MLKVEHTGLRHFMPREGKIFNCLFLSFQNYDEAHLYTPIKYISLMSYI